MEASVEKRMENPSKQNPDHSSFIESSQYDINKKQDFLERYDHMSGEMLIQERVKEKGEEENKLPKIEEYWKPNKTGLFINQAKWKQIYTISESLSFGNFF